MTRTIWKYEPLNSNMELDLPTDATILDVQIQQGALCLWVSVDPEAEKMKRYFAILPTGGEIEPEFSYLKTIQDGPLVWHIFEVLSGGDNASS